MRILVIDDDPLLLRSLRDTLEADGHVITTGNGGQAGIDVFEGLYAAGETVDVVMTDLGMPQVDGRMVAAAVKALQPAVPVMLLTGSAQRLAWDGDVLAGIDKVLGKPPKLSELRTALSQLVPEP